MATKMDIKKLLAGGLTGKEAARLILQDSWDVDHHKEGFLSDRDISTIKVNLKTTQDIEDYNKRVELYRLIDYSLKEARIFALEAESYLLTASSLIKTYEMEDRVRVIEGFLLPAIVTQKQYEELKAKQKASWLKEVNNLKQILDMRAQSFTSETVQEEWREGDEEGSYEYLVDHLREKYPDLWKRAVSEILEVIRSGQLKPVQLSSKEGLALEKLWKKIREAKTDLQEVMTVDAIQEKTGEGSLWDKEKKFIQKSYEAGLARDSQASIVAGLEQLLESSLSEEDEDKLLEYVFCSGADLYQAGLPEWIKQANEYIPSLDEESSARPAGMMGAAQVAIIQDPKPDDLDERGYWKAKEITALNNLSGYERRKRKKTAGEFPDLAETIKHAHKMASEKIKIFLAIQAVTDVLSKTVGVNFSEDMEVWYKQLENVIHLYNLALTPRSEFHGLPHYLGMPKLDRLKIGRLKPLGSSVRYYQDRMAIAMGENWLNGLINTMQFEPVDQDSLAQEMIQDIEAFRAEGGSE